MLTEIGFHGSGDEIMYNGMTGEKDVINGYRVFRNICNCASTG